MTTLLNAQRQFDQYAFQNELPIPHIIDGTSGEPITLGVWQTSQFLGLYDVHGDRLYTTVWGYGESAGDTTYPGPTILAYEGVPITVNWQNNLPLTGHLLPVDTSLHFAESTSHALTDGFVPIVTHLHGGHNDSNFDGLPDQWFTQFGPDGSRDVGSKFFSSSMTYDNDQQAATLWYHDHALGMTRLNVYAGLAGFYVLQDENRLNLVEQGVLPSGDYDIGMAIQDRAFTKDGQLYYPAYKNDLLPGTHDTVKDVVPKEFYKENGNDAPSVVPEFFGDHILVNGMAWPKLDVAAGDYEFRLLNGSDSRFYVLEVSDPHVAVHLVGTDGGLLHQAVTISDGDGTQESNEFLVLAPGDRVELVFDFSNVADGHTVNLLNVGPAFEPFKGLAGADDTLAGGAIAATADDPVGNIMQFVVDTGIDAFDATVHDGTVLVQNFVSLTQDTDNDDVADLATNVRKVGLFEGVDDFGRVTPMLGKAEEGTIITDKMSPGDFGPLLWDAPTTEKPLLGSTEQWDMFNFTEDSHPIHLHLTQYQVLEKRHIDFLDGDGNGIPDDTNHDGEITYGKGSSPDYAVADIWIGDKVDLRPEETGWQDTAWVDPHQMMSVVATFDKLGDYVWHCHILSHEDNEMMRPYTVEVAGGSSGDLVGSGDFNDDGISDLLIIVDNPGAGTRQLLVDQMNQGGIQAQFQIAERGTDWIVDGTGDFNGNGTSDILQHRDVGSTRTLEVSVMNNNVVQSNTTLGVNGTDWQLDAIGDFNGNGTSDILQHQISAGAMTLRDQLVSNNVVQSVATLAVRGADWQVDGTGDFNHDGISDILMHRDSSSGVRTLEVLTIHNNAVTSATVIAQVGTNISVDGIGDFNGDGTSDIALHQDVGTTRTDLIYDVVNNTVVNPHTVAVTGIDWHVA